MGATHEVVADERNEFSIVGIRDGTTLKFQLVPRQQAAVSGVFSALLPSLSTSLSDEALALFLSTLVFDSAFMVGDGIWEGIRVKRGVVQFARDHLNRLFESAKAMCESIPVSLPTGVPDTVLTEVIVDADMDLQISKSELLNLIHQSIDANVSPPTSETLQQAQTDT